MGEISLLLEFIPQETFNLLNDNVWTWQRWE